VTASVPELSDEGEEGCPPTRRARKKDKDAENAKLKLGDRAAWVSAGRAFLSSAV
jgi:hypothetical protein